MISSVFCLFFRESREQRCQMPLTSMLMGQLDRLWLSTICLAVLNDWQCVFIQTLFSLPCISLPTLLAWKKYLFDLKGLTKSLKRWTRVYSRDIANIGILFFHPLQDTDKTSWEELFENPPELLTEVCSHSHSNTFSLSSHSKIRFRDRGILLKNSFAYISSSPFPLSCRWYFKNKMQLCPQGEEVPLVVFSSWLWQVSIRYRDR